MNPSRVSIHEAIERLRGLKGSTAMFQSLAEAYAQRMFPERFPSLEPRGMSPLGTTMKGWPDAYTIRPDGRIEAISETKRLDWLLLTKRPENILAMTPWNKEWPTNVWVGTTVESQEETK